MKSYDVPVIFRVKARLKWWNFATIRSTKGDPT
jgi:hypothetical protein